MRRSNRREGQLITHRVLLHNHSTWSDGQLSLNEVVRVGERFGASAIAMSEHDFDFTSQKWSDYIEACRLASTKSCVIIPGIEYSSPDDDVHVVTVGAEGYFGARRDLTETLAAVHAEGGANILAHPRRRDCFGKITPELLHHIDAIEIWNRKVDGLLPVRSYFDFAKTYSLAITVGMDLHTWRQIFPMWNIVIAHTGPLDGKFVAGALRDRTITPACFIGRLSQGLAHPYSIEIGTLAAAEKLRRLLRGLRDFANTRRT
jgi:predicted metal-dependent phosphoesterase TrpH